MRQFKVLVLAVFAVCAVAVVAASSASAQGLPTVTPTAKTNSTDAISLSLPKYELTNKNTVVCALSTVGTSTEDSSPSALGRFHITFKECVGTVSGISAKCTGLGDTTTGEILTLGEYHLVYDTGGTELGVAILFLVETLHFTCAGLFLNTVSGEQLCLLKNPYVASTLKEMVCEQAAGVQKETYLNDSGVTVAPKLTVVEGEGTNVGAAEEAKALLLFLNASKANVSTTVVMN